MVVGITGGIGSGKSLVAKHLCSFENTCYYHADEEAKKLMNTSTEIKKMLVTEFGKESYTTNGLNRPYIAAIVFKNPEKLQKLNSIVHPVVKKHFRDFIMKYQGQIVVYENAILFEIGSDAICDFVINVNAEKEERIQRVISRDQTTREAVEERMKNQWSDTKRNLLSNYLIFNQNKSETLLKIERIHNFLTKKLLLV